MDRMIIKVSDGQPFSEMFTESCRDLSKIRVDYRKAGDPSWKKYTGRRGNIQLDKKKIEIRKIRIEFYPSLSDEDVNNIRAKIHRKIRSFETQNIISNEVSCFIYSFITKLLVFVCELK